MAKRGKKYLEAAALIDKEVYELSEAIELLKKTAVTKFDSSCEVHFKLGVDPKQADQNIRTTVSLPHGTGKDVKVVAFVSEDKIKEAKAAGALEAGTAVLVEKIEKGWLDFDVAVATPDQMKSLGKIAKTLGQKRLMPSPKAGTVSEDFAKTIGEVKKGKIEVRVDKDGNLHNIFGKASFSSADLEANLRMVINTVKEVKPNSTKGSYVRSINLTTSMGPGISLKVNSAMAGN